VRFDYARRLRWTQHDAYEDHPRRNAVRAILALVPEALVAIDNSDPIDFYDDHDDDRDAGEIQ
jgi:hypothetical protein